MSYPLTEVSHQLGPRPFNHSQSASAEQEYDRLRALARQAHDPATRRQYNKQASEFIFRENNAPGRVHEDEIDLHGQFVEEAEEILEQRIRYAQSSGQTHLHVIVGKGNHSSNHIQKLKPKVEEVCRDLGLQYSTEHNAGRIYINLQGGAAQMPSHLISDPGAYAHHNPSQYHGQNQFVSPQGPQPQYPGGHQGYQGHQPHAHHQQAGNAQDEEIERVVKRYLPKLLRQLKRSCCTVM